ncbi:MAG: autotransporter domain-containing protein [Pseudomonadales bacterium]|jgi:outer membrane autotransporter protein|nr:autotransporter domain-containing protein [Pseudomonadales bacterium]
MTRSHQNHNKCPLDLWRSAATQAHAQHHRTLRSAVSLISLLATLPLAAPAWAQSLSGTANQQAVGAAVATLDSGNVLRDAVAQMNADTARAAFDQLSGELHASTATALLEDSRFVREAALDRMRGAASDGTEVWSRFVSNKGKTDGDANATLLNHDTRGVFVGADGQPTSTLRAGVLAGYSRTTFDGLRGDGNSSNVHFGAHLSGQWDNLALRLGVTYSKHYIDSTRAVSFATVSNALHGGDNGANTTQLFGEVGYRIPAEMFTWEPFANLARVRLSVSPFSLEKDGVAALKGLGDAASLTFTTLGVHGQSQLALGAMEAALKGSLGWRHAFGDTTPQSTLSFASGDAFVVTGVPVASNMAVLDLGLNFTLTPNAWFNLAYTGQFGSGTTDNGLRGDIRMRF